MTRNASLATLGLVSLLALGACAQGPDPEALSAPSVPATYDSGAAPSVGPEVATRAFWAEYRDPMLNQILARGLSQNLSILAANERIRAAEASLQGASPLAAQLGGAATAGRERIGAEGISSSETGSTLLSANFVLDLFGGAMRARQGAAANVTATEARAEVVRQAYLAEVIAAYGGARAAQESLALTRATLATRERTVEITRSRMAVGSATQFDLAQVEALLEMTRAEIPTLNARFSAQVYRLAVLLNEPAEGLMRQMQRGAPQLRVPATPNTGVPADLLRNRPDIRAAEADLSAALAQVGVAEAALLPSLSLTGRVSDLGGANAWGFGPQLSLPIFNQGALQANRNRRVSEAQQAQIAWRSAVNSAVGTVQTAQSNLRRNRQQLAALRSAVEAYDRAYRLAEQNYEAGALPLLNLLEVDRARASARLAVAAAQQQAALEWASLQIAIGAGAQAR